MPIQNFYITKISNDIGSTDTTINVDTAPAVTAGYLVLEARNPSKREIISYTGVSGLQLTGVTRGIDGTNATPHLSGSTIQMNMVNRHFQDLLDAYQSFVNSNASWIVSTTVLSGGVYNGNRSYTFNTSTDQRANWSPGMRIRTTRGTAAPNQCASLNGTNQYFSKSSPVGMTFTDDFTVSAWVKLSSYNAIAMAIVTRWNGASGWSLKLNSNGTIEMAGFNGNSANYSLVNSYQSVPLNKWVHITGQLDMSAFTQSPTTSYIMIDGVEVPSYVARAGTNPTALIQAGNLEIGSWNGGAQPFPGGIAQVAVFNAKVTQATMRGYMSQGLTGSEPNLISAFSLSNTLNDLNTTTANNLTAQNGATATNANSPFGGQAGGTISTTLDYAIIHAVTSTTVTLQVPEGCTIPTTGTIAQVAYSTMKSPHGFPVQSDKWRILTTCRIIAQTSAPVANTWYNLGSTSLSVPVGQWSLTFVAVMAVNRAAAGATDMRATLSTTNNGETNKDLTFAGGISSVTDSTTPGSRSAYADLSAPVTYYVNTMVGVSGVNVMYNLGDRSPTNIYAENTLL